MDAVVVARRTARALAEREGMAGLRRALGDLIDRVPGATTAHSAADPDAEVDGRPQAEVKDDEGVREAGKER
jgi:hypothetical protein